MKDAVDYVYSIASSLLKVKPKEHPKAIIKSETKKVGIADHV